MSAEKVVETLIAGMLIPFFGYCIYMLVDMWINDLLDKALKKQEENLKQHIKFVQEDMKIQSERLERNLKLCVRQ